MAGGVGGVGSVDVATGQAWGGRGRRDLVVFVGFEAFAVVRAKLRTPEILARNAHPVTTLGQLGRRRVAILLRVEDPGFHHRGVDYATLGQGRTTMIQALVKRPYFNGRFTPGFAKIE